MSFPNELLKELPSTFYRVSVKVLVFDDRQRLLMYVNHEHKWEIPGGGLEHGESIEACVGREMKEEVGLMVTAVEPVRFAYAYRSRKGYYKVCLVVPARVDSHEVPDSQEVGILKAWYVSKEEALSHEFQPGEEGTKRCIELLWS